MAVLDVFAYFETITKIYSPSLFEDELLEYIKAEIDGFQVPLIHTGPGGLIARIPETKEGFAPLFFAAHLDTATNGEKPVIELSDGYYRSSSGYLGADDKAGVAAMLAVIKTVQEDTSLEHGPLEFIFTTREEAGLLGAKMLDLTVLESRYGFCLDAPGKVGSFQRISDTHAELNVTVIQSFKDSDVSAINIARAALHRIRKSRMPQDMIVNVLRFDGTKNQLGEETVRVELTIAGEFVLDSRLEAIEGIRQLFDQTGAKYGASVDSELHISYPGFKIRDQHPAVLLAKQAARKAELKNQEVVFLGGSDASIFNERGLETLLLSVGYENPHTEKERIAQAELENLSRLLLAIISSARGMEVITEFPPR
ncbi:peptidase M20/M25/M40 family protein [Listeria floridensis FSL S10-1187]|uniref:Peptidase M20/M25/M40 family protein n=1 Tax=Listeria floridensis FSL S10-1187 TaxID=1265817 RepID=A0ABN0RF15_9LIST|nr:M20/M25/M40 family metallo-hydrolase [Listeria floridensis]EUJ31805.1 peptidase M20/M25/M40 family protein [Listeria floridensis FSL S10-1187]